MSGIQSLTNNWQFRQLATEQWRSATVPGCVHLDLLQHGLIEDPFYRDNEKSVQWIDKTDWEYRLIFDVADDLFNQAHIEIQFDGLDTYADVYLNRKKILYADNMFRIWNVEIKSLLQKENNELLIHFRSPINEILPHLKNKACVIPAISDQGEGTSPYTRKAPYQFGWDWGPRLVTSGVWKKARLVGWQEFKFTDFQVKQLRVSAKEAVLELGFEIWADSPQKIDLAIAIPETTFASVSSLKLEEGINQLSETIRLNEPFLWYPHGYGEQHLYKVKLKAGSAHHSQLIEKRIGLRKLEVRREQDEQGEGFAFFVNDIPVFAKGANWIPADNFTPRVDKARYEYLLKSAREAHMNMLRVWGGGIYEDDLFYELCDEMGILVWQDFMFSCSMYPADDKFLNSVRREASDQVRRLRHHPCIALWCGNNENEMGWESWGWQEKYPPSLIEDYQKLTYGTLAQVCLQYDPSRLYWPSSPASDVVFAPDPNGQKRGDVHYWGVWHNKEPFENFHLQTPRFASEYGFQSFPEPKTVQTYTIPEDHDILSPVMKWHQRHPNGNELIKNYMEQYYRIPHKFENFLWLSQILQAEGIKSGAEHFRRIRPHCMGSLYWQINDCWPVASWSSIDYYGRWKALHYYARRFYAPVLISPLLEKDCCQIFVVSDLPESSQAEFLVEVMDFAGHRLFTDSRQIEIHSLASQLIFEKSLRQLPANFKAEESLLYCSLIREGEPLSENILYFAKPKDQALPTVQIDFELFKSADGFLIRLTTANLARHVILEAPEIEGRFEDNFFDMIPKSIRQIHFKTREPITEDLFRQALKIHTLSDLIG